jgi:2-polyprenyl-3-methyl-5-hydroxy-6-metoxy-1,4-benzoquinol methylase
MASDQRHEGGYDANDFERLSVVEQRSFWFRARNGLIVDLVSSLVAPGSTFLEVGCGTGFVAKALVERCRLKLTGIDVFEEGLKYARQRVPAATFRQVNLLDPEVGSNFDAAGAFDVVEHIPDDLAALAALRNTVRPGGYVFITVPQHAWLWSAFDDAARHVRRYSRRLLVARVRSAGLQPVVTTSFVSSLLPLMAIARLRNRRLSPGYDPVQEFKLPRYLDQALERCLNIERFAIRHRLSLPAGGSLVVVANRPF